MSLALLIASLVASALGTIPGVPSVVATVIQSISGIVGVLIKNGIGSGSPVTVSLILTTLQGVITQLKSVPGLNQSALNDIAVLDDALAAALAQQATITSVDPTKLNPITPIP